MFSLLCHLFLLGFSLVAAMPNKPTVVIVPGSWQLPIVWDEFRSVLEGAGHEAHHVALPSIGGTTLPLTGLPEDVAAVRDVLNPLVAQGKEIVLLCHSSGGIVGSNAVEGFDVAARQAAGEQGGVVRIVYLAAFMLPQGQSLIGLLGGQPLPWMVIGVSSIPFPPHVQLDPGLLTPSQEDRVSGDPALFPEVGFNDLPAEEQTRWAQEATYTSLALFTAPSAYEPWANGIPGAFIFTTLDNALPYPLQQGMAAQLGPDFRNATLESGHCPFLSMPQQLLAALEQVVC
jgi:pimeloyl-ACP methyl ester carboxylesterase